MRCRETRNLTSRSFGEYIFHLSRKLIIKQQDAVPEWLMGMTRIPKTSYGFGRAGSNPARVACFFSGWFTSLYLYTFLLPPPFRPFHFLFVKRGVYLDRFSLILVRGQNRISYAANRVESRLCRGTTKLFAPHQHSLHQLESPDTLNNDL
jgi:hypothetical protein